MIICSKCGAEMKEGAAYCTACGSGMPGQDDGSLYRKRARPSAQEKKRGKAAAIIAAVLSVVMSAGGLYYVFRARPVLMTTPAMVAAPSNAPGSPLPVTVQSEGGEVRVPLENLGEGSVHFYSYAYRGKVIKFFLFRKPDGSVGAALDSCDSCYRAKRGFRSQDDFVVCNDCGMSIRLRDIGVVTGGCNPVPLAARTAGGMAVLNAADLEARAKYF